MPEAASIPPMTVEPSTRRETAPEPWQTTMASSRQMKAKDVIRIGRRRKLRAFERGIDQRFAFLVFGLGKFDNQDGVFGRQTNEHDHTDLRIDIIFHVAQSKVDEGAKTAIGVPESTLNGRDQLS